MHYIRVKVIPVLLQEACGLIRDSSSIVHDGESRSSVFWGDVVGRGDVVVQLFCKRLVSGSWKTALFINQVEQTHGALSEGRIKVGGWV